MDSYDVAVIGGGIIGASAANHLSAAGFATVLIDKGDIGGATSGRTSRLQYCGLSYFSTFRSLTSALGHPAQSLESVQLARQAMRDRSGFVRATPERVRPVPFYFPLYNDGSIPVWKVRAGLKLLEMLDPGGVKLGVQFIAPAEARGDPLLQHLRAPDRLVGVLRYTEYQFDWPERICVDTALNAVDNGARILTYAPVTRITRSGDLWEAEMTDPRSGTTTSVRARAVVNAAGVWVDDFAGSIGAPRLNQGAKGVNVVVRLPEEFRGIGFETMTRGGEPFYVIPWDDLHYFGPRNRAQDASEEGFLVTEQEIVDLLDEINHHFPALQVRRANVLYCWAGVRPRTARPGFPAGGPGSQLHDLHDRGLPNYFVYTGGLLMTHRNAGRVITKAVSRRTTPSAKARPVSYAARRFPDDHNTPVVGEHYRSVSQSDVRFACSNEMVQGLEDLMFRRVRLGWTERMGADVAHDVARSVRDVMGWSLEDADARAARYVSDLRHRYQLKPER